MILMKGTKSCLAVSRETWQRDPILAQIVSNAILLPFVQNRVIILIGGEINSNGLNDLGETAAASAKQLKKYLRRCQFSVPILPLKTSAFDTKSYAAARSDGSLYRRGRLSLTESKKSS